MENADEDAFPDPEIPGDENEHTHDPIANLFPRSNLPSDPHYPPLSETTPSLSPYSITTVPLTFTGEDAVHVDNLLYYGVDSPILPPDIQTALTTTAATTSALYPTPPLPLPMSTALDASPLPFSSGSSGSANTCAMSASPPGYKHHRYHIDSPNQTQEPAVHPIPRYVKRRSGPYPGQSTFRLDSTVAPLEPREPYTQPVFKSHTRGNYSLCRCPSGLTSNPPRHWDTCPYNPEGGKKAFSCEICGDRFTTKWNKNRHIKSCHSSGVI